MFTWAGKILDMGKVEAWERWHAGFVARILHVTWYVVRESRF